MTPQQIAELINALKGDKKTEEQGNPIPKRKRKFKRSDRKVLTEADGTKVYEFPDGKKWKFTSKRVDAFKKMQQERERLKAERKAKSASN